MPGEKPDVLLIGAKKPVIVGGLTNAVNLHPLEDAKDKDAFLNSIADKVRAIAVSLTAHKIDADLMQRFPKLELVSTFGVGYDHVDAKWAGAHGITVTNTPGVLNEEVADTALGLLLSTVRELPQAERYLRAGKWPSGNYPLTNTLRDRTVGMVGMGRIGQAIARRIEAFGVPVVYHSRSPQQGVKYKYYPKLIDMARDVDTLMVIVPGGPATQNIINKEVLEALGPARHPDQHGARLGGRRAGADRGAEEQDDPVRGPRRLRQGAAGAGGAARHGPHRAVPAPRLGLGATPARRWTSWWSTTCWHGRAGKPPLTPVPETPWPPKR